MTIREWLRENSENYSSKNELVNACSKSLKVNPGSVKCAYFREYGAKSSAPKPVVGLQESDLRAKYDNTYKIREGIKTLPKKLFLTDQQMREHCGISPNLWRSYSENQEFDRFKWRPNSKDIYWARPENIKQISEAINA